MKHLNIGPGQCRLAIIIASFRHAARTVLQRELPDAWIAARVGGAGLYEQMAEIAPDFILPGQTKTVKELLESLPSEDFVQKLA